MSSRGVALLGAQQPRVRLCPTSGADREDGDEAVALASAYSLVADDWQADVVGNWLARRKDGRLAAGICGLAVPRQNGKNGILEIVELHKIVAQGRRILHTAHEVKTARKAFLRLKSFFENEVKWPELAALVKEIRQTNGQEAIVLTNGGSVEFVARSRGSGRGFTVDDLVCDEAQELTDEQLEALLPTISAAPSGDPQQIYTGTPPPPNSPGTVFRRVRTDGVAGKNKRLCWDEWSIPDDADAVQAQRDEHLLYATNPALGRRLNRTTAYDERDAMSPEGYARERLGKWAAGVGIPPTIDAADWSALIGSPPSDGRTALGVKFSLDGERVALAAAIRPDAGPIHVEVIAERAMSDGLGWLVDVLVPASRTAAAVVIDGKSGAGDLRQRLTDAKARERTIIAPTTDQVISAHTSMLGAITDKTVTHSNQPGLNAAVACATQRKIGTAGGWGWQASSDGDVLPLEAATLALWGAITKAKPRSGNSGWKVVT